LSGIVRQQSDSRDREGSQERDRKQGAGKKGIEKDDEGQGGPVRARRRVIGVAGADLHGRAETVRASEGQEVRDRGK